MEQFDEIFTDATAHVGQEFFLLRVYRGDPVHRERVYCYELYHQLRCRWPDSPYTLNGEIDKQKHPDFENAYKPDMLVHVPGQDDNFAVIEVKPSFPSAGNIANDVDKLIHFLDYGYTRGLYLLYGCHPEEAAARIAATYGDNEKLVRIELWVHSGAGKPAVMVDFS